MQVKDRPWLEYCPTCWGTGASPDWHNCQTCGGKGKIPAKPWPEGGYAWTERLAQECEKP